MNIVNKVQDQLVDIVEDVPLEVCEDRVVNHSSESNIKNISKQSEYMYAKYDTQGYIY